VGYSGPHGTYPVYRCTADKALHGEGPACQEVRAPDVDAEVERLVLAALAPDGVALALAALGEMEAEARLLERQWSLRRERARYEAERARRQYDAVEPENRLVARSLERAWEDRLRAVEQVEQEHRHWQQQQQPLSLDEADRAAILALGADLPRVWQAGTTTAAERKRIVRLVVQEVVLDRTRRPGRICLRVLWQAGAASEHWVRRRVQAYDGHAELGLLERRVRELNATGTMDGEIAAILNAEGLAPARGAAFDHHLVHLLRKRWGIATVRLTGAGGSPARWPDGSYSVRGAAQVLAVAPHTIFQWLKSGRLPGRQVAKGQPWQITLPDGMIQELRSRGRGSKSSTKEAS
jgi:hypothetical protein